MNDDDNTEDTNTVTFCILPPLPQLPPLRDYRPPTPAQSEALQSFAELREPPYGQPKSTTRVTIYEATTSGRNVIGTVHVAGGVAVPSASVAEFLATIRVIEPETFVRLTPADGERYLRALPANLKGVYLWAEVEE